MEDDQQFCLRWNNHQSTLVAVFDTLLENGTLVDCTLAAEGKFLNAHKVVLSACSPYFEALLSKHFDKHPILILKDVKFQELKAMMDYMYRGEVNISQDQLGALLKAAESLQIKGLSDNRKGETERKPAPAPPPPKSPQPASTIPKVQGLTIEQRSRDDSREGSMSPGPRKKKRMRRKSEELDNHHDASNSSESHSLPATQNIPLLPTSKMNADVPDTIETKQEILTARLKQSSDEAPQVPMIKEKLETHSELMLEPKAEYVEEMNEDSIEDLTLDDDDLSNMEQMDGSGAGPSHGNAGEGSSQGFGGWHMGNQSQDEVFLAAQEAVGAHRDSQGQMQRKRNRKKINILMNQKIAAAKKTGATNKRGSDELDSSDRPKKKPMVIEFDDNLRLQGTSVASNEKSTREFLDALQSLRSNQELQHVLQYMNKFSVPPPNVSMPPPMNVKPPPRIQFAPLTPHTFYPRPPFMIRYVNRAFVMRKVPRAIPVKAHVLAKTESITDVPLSELMMRSKKSGEAVVPHAKVYEVSRGNPWMRSFQSVYLRPPFPSRTYRRPILSNVGFTGTFYIPSPIESAPKDVKATNVAIMDDKIDEKKGDAETKAGEMDISCDGADKDSGDASFDGDIDDKTADESGLVEGEIDKLENEDHILEDGCELAIEANMDSIEIDDDIFEEGNEGI